MVAFTSGKVWKFQEVHLPWSGPHSVVMKLSDVTYRIHYLQTEQEDQESSSF